MKGINIWCEVVCNKCNKTMDCGAYYQNSSTIAKLRKRAKEYGWKVIDGNTTYCPECVEKSGYNGYIFMKGDGYTVRKKFIDGKEYIKFVENKK